MAGASTTLHEPGDLLSPETIETHRAIVSLMEELEAVDWYNQRVNATGNPQLQAILAHNRDEEKEHAMMLLEWLRRSDPSLAQQMRTYLFTDGGIVATEEESGAVDSAAATDSVSLGIGSLKEAP